MKTYHSALFVMLFLILVAASIPVHAQPSLAIGPKVGASFSGFRGDDAGDINFRKGLAGGVFVNVSPVKFFSFQPELLLQQKGAVNENEEFNFREDVKIGYLNVPMLFKLRLPIDDAFFPHVYVGPQFSYAFKSEYSITMLNGTTLTREIDLRNYDLGGVFGFGLDIESNHLFFTTDFRYGLGALNLDENDEAKLKNKDMAILLGLGYKF
ncbi:MAG TPA: porin family protein [Chitinophagales bacterium]|nr:porin family protein [Chitinophagales bacterium]